MDIIKLPEGKTPIDSEWICTVKYKAFGKVERFKTRHEAKGYVQREVLTIQRHFLS